MTLYRRAIRHAQLMMGMLAAAIVFVISIDQLLGQSVIAFGIAIAALVFANTGMLQFRCPNCRKNLFFRGMLVVPWPNRKCTRCGTDLDRIPAG